MSTLPDLGPLSNRDEDVEMLGAVEAVHRFVKAPGDDAGIQWHVVECGPADPTGTVVFLHGLPDSWWQWHHVMERLGGTMRCLSVDLKGYGQSDKAVGDYTQGGVALQLLELLDMLVVNRFTIVAHDRGAVVADHLVAAVGDRIERYVRCQQHLWHLHPDLYPQEAMFLSSAAPQILGEARQFVSNIYTVLTRVPLSDADLSRTVAEFSHPGIAEAVPRYFVSSSFQQEWIDRRERLIAAWDCPVILVQGVYDAAQPPEFYEDPEVLSMLPAGSALELFGGGHLWPLEEPQKTVDLMISLLGVQ